MERAIVLSKKVGPGAAGPGVNPAAYSKYNAAMQRSSQVFRDAANSSGEFHAQQMRVNSATDEYTRALEKQKVSFRDWRKQQSVARAAYKEQLAMQQMVVRQVPGTAGGKNMLDVVVPNEVHKSLDTFSNKVGWARAQLASFSTQMVNWGKNTQWAGRQLMVGFTVPVAAFGVAAGVMAYQVDSAMTRIQKVYDTTANASSKSAKVQAQVQTELNQLRANSLATAMTAAKQYGASAKDTLGVQADLAATGLKGVALQQSTNEVMRISTLGELDKADATKTAIALQTAFKLNTQELTEAFNFMNATENATSLSIQDIAEATPRAASAMSALGVNVKEMTVMLTSMKESGVDAAEAANALKSATGTILAPSPQADAFIKQISDGRIHIMDLAKASGGNLYKAMGLLFNQMEGLSKLEKQQILVKLFGKYQFNRVSAMLYNMGDAFNGVQNQTHKAMSLMGDDSKTLADIADRELKRYTDSAAGQFKTTVETMKIQLSQMGKPFLEIGVHVVKVIAKIMSAFNGLPDGFKRFIAGGAILMALVGPVVMLTGLFANFAGNILKFGVAMTGVFTKFELLNKESAAARAAAKFASEGFITQGTAAERLTQQLQMLTDAQIASNRAAHQAMFGNSKMPFQGMFAGGGAAAAPSAPGLWPGAASGVRPPGGWTPTTTNAPVLNPMFGGKQYDASPVKTGNIKDTAVATERVSHGMKAAAVSGGIFAGAMAASMISSNKTVDKISQIAMMTAIIGPGLAGMAKALKEIQWAAIASGITTKVGGAITLLTTRASLFGRVFAQAPGTAGKLSVVFRTLGLGIKAMLGPIGIFTALLGAAATAAYLINKHSKEAANNLKKAWDNPKPIAEIMGYTAVKPEDVVTKNPEVQQITQVKKVADAYPELITRIKSAQGEQNKFNEAMRLGLQVIQSGGTAAQARNAVKLALQAAEDDAKAAKIILHFKGDLDFNDPNTLRKAAERAAQQSMDFANKHSDASYVGKTFLHPFGIGSDGAMDVSAESKQAIKSAAKQTTEIYNQGLAETGTAMPFVNSVQKQLDDVDKLISKSSGDTKKNFQGVRRELLQQILIANGGKDVYKSLGDEWYKSADAMEVLNNTIYESTRAQRINFLERKKNTTGLSAGEKERLQNLYNEKNAIGITNNLLGDTADEASKWVAPMAAVYSNTKSIPGAVAAVTAEERRATAQANALAAAAGRVKKAYNAIDWKGMAKGAMTSTQDYVAGIATENFDAESSRIMDKIDANQAKRQQRMENAQQNASERLDNRQTRASEAQDARQENQNTAFENRWDRRKKAVEGYFDAKKKAVDNAIKSEEKAEATRQKIFDAEIARQQRLADTANMNIDFNVAINTGKLDEAAKIRNDMQAKETEWALGDAGKSASDKSAARIDKLQAKGDNIDKAKQKRLDELKNTEDAEKRSLEKRQKAAQKALENRQKAETKALAKKQAADKAALDKELANNKIAEQKKLDLRKEKLDRAIEAFKAYVPKNEADLQAHIKRISAKYGDFNVGMRTKFNNTAVSVHDELIRNMQNAAKAMRSDIQWEAMANDIARKMIRGAFGMNTSEFKDWMTTGIWPKGATPPKASDYASPKPSSHKGGVQDSAFHTGGRIGKDKGGRNGYARTAPLSRNEMNITAEKGEFVVNKHAAAKHGRILGDINADRFTPFGPVTQDLQGKPEFGGQETSGGLGFAGIMSAMMAQAIKSTVSQGARTGAQHAIAKQGSANKASGAVYGSAKAGHYGDTAFSPEQLKNAATIATVGHNMGMSSRDVTIALMTAMQESMLRNVHYGDRDSQGLFQQRPSMGWGTVAQVTNPTYAATQFFSHLKKIGNRGDMSLGAAAQKVQGSAFPDAYAKWENEARAIQGGMKQKQDGGFTAAAAAYKGGSAGPANDIGKRAMAWAAARIGDTGWYRLCQSFVRQSLGAGGGAATAQDAWNRANGKHGIGDKTAVPAGVPVYWGGGGAGHVALSTGGGGIISTDFPTSGRIGRGTIAGLTSAWHKPLLGWTSDINGKKVYGGATSMRVGGFTQSDGLANLHKGEAVLTKPMTKDMKEGVKNFAEGGKTEYNITVMVNGTSATADEIARKVEDKMRLKEARKPQSRKGH